MVDVYEGAGLFGYAFSGPEMGTLVLQHTITSDDSVHSIELTIWLSLILTSYIAGDFLLSVALRCSFYRHGTLGLAGKFCSSACSAAPPGTYSFSAYSAYAQGRLECRNM